MFATQPASYADIDAAEEELIALEAIIARARARQLELLAWLDDVKVARVHGSRSMEEWTAAHLDVAPPTARHLVTTARASRDAADGLDCVLETLVTGEISFDRAVATTALSEAGANERDIEASLDRDLTGVRRQTARFSRITRLAEREIMKRRHLTILPTLGETAWRLEGLAPGFDGDIIARALEQRADRLPAAPAAERDRRSQRLLDALTALAQDYLDGDTNNETSSLRRTGSAVTVFMDTRTPPDVESDAEIASGPRVGPDTIERILCEGSAVVVTMDRGRPVASSKRTRTIPPAIRDAVLHRDGGCVMDGCRSTYRLQPHHVRPWSEGGDHEISNLASLCWYHHHIAVHGYGKQLDPDSPSQKRRFFRRPSAQPP